MKKFIYLFIIVLVFYIYIYFGQALIYKKINNLKINGLLNYIYVFNEIFVNEDYKFLNKKNIIYFDVGGNNGLYSLYLNENNENIQVHVFEPVNELYQNIVWNINQTKKTNNKFFINNIGLGEVKKEIEINYFPNADALSTIKNDLIEKKKAITNQKCKLVKNIPIINTLCKNLMKKIIDNNNFNSEKRKIKIDTLNNYILNKNITRIDIMKIDVEGYELEVLYGINSENFKKIKTIFIEIENYRENYKNQIINILSKNNFNYKIIGNSDWIDLIATNKNN